MLHAHTHARQCMQVCAVNGLCLPGVDEFEGLVQRGNRDHSQDGAEYLPIFHNFQKKKRSRLAAEATP